MSTPTNTFRCSIEIGPRDGSRFQRVITVAGSENIYSVLPSTLLQMLPMAEVRIRINGEERTTSASTAKPTASPSLAATPWPHSAWLRTTMNRNWPRLTCS